MLSNVLLASVEGSHSINYNARPLQKRSSSGGSSMSQPDNAIPQSINVPVEDDSDNDRGSCTTAVEGEAGSISCNT